jgi:hypothetical protein
LPFRLLCPKSTRIRKQTNKETCNPDSLNPNPNSSHNSAETWNRF